MSDVLRQYFEPGGHLELMGRGDVAKALGVPSSNIYSVRDLTPPVARISSGPVWLARDIREFARRREVSKCSSH